MAGTRRSLRITQTAPPHLTTTVVDSASPVSSSVWGIRPRDQNMTKIMFFHAHSQCNGMTWYGKW